MDEAGCGTRRPDSNEDVSGAAEVAGLRTLYIGDQPVDFDAAGVFGAVVRLRVWENAEMNLHVSALKPAAAANG